MIDIWAQTVTVFATQLIFIGTRTWNVKAIAAHDLNEVLISGAIIHLAWLVSITLGVNSMVEIMRDFQWEYLIVICGSLSGGLLGSYLGMRKKWAAK